MLEQRMLALAERFIGFSAQERRNLQARMREQGLSLEALPVPPRDAGLQVLPASHAQQRMWFLWQLEPAATAYNQLAVLRLRGQLDVAALRQSFQALVERHEPLRTRFELDDGQVMQHIEPAATFELPVLDLRDQGDAAEALAQAEIERQGRAGFDLQHGPLLRASLVRTADDQYLLLFCTHHIICDAWSLPILVNDLTAAYARLSAGGAAPAPAPLAVQYADCARWQRLWLEAGEAERQLAYWRDTLGEPVDTLALPWDRLRPAVRSGRGARLPIELSTDLSQAVRQFAAAQGATPFMVLLGAFQLLLHRYSGAADIRVGTPLANRNRRETEALIGLFVNTQVLRAQIDGSLSFVELVQQAKARVLEAQAHQDLPFEQLVDALAPERRLDQTPLFQVMYNHQVVETRAASLSLPGLDVEALDQDQASARFDLTLNTQDDAGQLSASLVYACDLFEAATVERMGAHWRRLLEAALSHPERALAELSPFLDSERDYLLQTCNPAQPMPAPCLLGEIAAQLRADPQRPALVFAGQVLSRAELDRRSNRLAHRLRSLGVGPEVLVGIALERSMDLVVALLAVLKAGGAYVPLDPDYPSERLSYMVEDSGLRLLLSAPKHLAQWTPPVTVSVQYLDDPSLDGLDESPLPISQQAEHLAYLIYTSGSTGRPKGAGNRYGALGGRLGWMRDTYAFDERDAILQKTSFSFDVSVWELLLPLFSGGLLVLAEPGEQREPERLVALIRQHAVSAVHFVPSMLQAFIDTPGLEHCASLRNLFSGGEALSRELQAKVLARLPAVALYNRYGPVEATINASHAGRASPGSGAVSIGRPLPGTRLHVLGDALQLLPLGAVGELHIGGDALSRGYHGRPGLTAERFLPDPYGEPGARLYRSGDLVRRQADGELSFVARIDHQVKIRGLRIELGEIESALLAVVGVREAVVLARDAGSGLQLVGYVVAADQALAGELPGRCREALQQSLPDYMVPAHILCLAQLPVTANGKLDRSALALPTLQRSAAFEPAQGEMEEQLAKLWSQVLKVEAVDRNDNFFELGGDSIMAIQVVSRARQAGILLTSRQMFQHQSVRALALVAERGMVAEVAQGPVVGEQVLLPIAEAFFAQPLAAYHHWNQSVLLAPRQPLRAELLEAALQALLVQHDALRLEFSQQDGAWQARYPVAQVGQTLLREFHLEQDDDHERCCTQVQQSLDLQAGPLLRAGLLHRADGSQRLLLVAHHLVIDGVSWRVLLEDLQQAYRQLERSQPLQLPAKTSPLQAWAEHLQRWASSDAALTQLDYWSAQLREVPALPCLDAQASVRAVETLSVQSRLTPAITRQLLQEAPSAYRTQVNDLLLTALARVIGGWTGARDTLIRLEGHGREELFDDIDLSRTLGWFTSVFPLRLTTADAVGDSIRQVKEQLRAVPDRGIGHGALRYLGPAEIQAELAAFAQPRITFNYLGQFDGSFDDNDTLFAPCAGEKGQERCADALSGNWLTLNGQVYDGQFSLDWTFSPAMFDVAQIQALADAYADELQRVVEHCCDPRNGGVTPSDFPLAGLDQQQLDRLPVAAQQIENLYPLAPMQQGMLFHSLYEQGSADYINQLQVSIDGLDVERFRQAWQACLQAHDVLRSAFIWQDDAAVPVQVVHKHVEIPFQVLDLAGADELALQRLADEQRAHGFDLGQAPLLRILLVRTAAQRYQLIYTSHHILMDGWSSSLLMGEVLQRYRGEPVSTGPGRYADYIGWLQRQDAARSEAFWREQLRDLQAPTLLTHALGLKEDTQAVGHGQLLSSLEPALEERLGAFARQHKVTLNTVVQAAWLVLLQRYAGQSPVVFGATVAGRPTELPGIEQQVGLFINTLPVIAAPAPEQSIAHWLQQVQALNVGLREHEHVPLADIQRWAGRTGEALFDNLLVFENYPVAEALQKEAPQGLLFGEVQMHEQTHLPLTVAVGLGERLMFQFTYSRRWFDQAQVEQLDSHLQQVLQGFLEHADKPLGELPLLAQAAQAVIREGWNATAQDYADKRCVHQVIAAQAQRTPDAVALVFAGQQMSYAQLERAANAWAHRLIEAGAGPDSLVGVAAHRSLDMVIGLLAVLKAGAAYVPLDPDYPSDRLAYMIEDSGIDLLLTQSALQASLPLPAHVRCLPLDQPQPGYPEHAPSVAPGPEHLAYVIYTSGSTGKPKGAGNRHLALSNRLNWMQQAYALEATDTVLQKTPFSFDVSVWEFFWPLMFGARLVIAEPGEHRDPARLVALITEQQVSTLHFVPSMLQAFMQDEGVAACTSLRRIICSGEALPVDAQAQVFEHLPAVTLYNLYGPTEAAIDVTHWTCRAEGADTVPIGEPIANLQTWILDASLQLLPAGVVGELYLGGEGLARGYHRRAALTAERFVANPFGGGRLYRTGDLARYREDGVIEYAGRIDHQVKIRGLRIELGEIEARLAEHRSVRETVVLARQQRLVAYLVLSEDAADWRASIERHLQDNLPDYMVPAQYIVLDSMPLSPNGKLDRKALPVVEATSSHAFAAPQGALENQLAAIWQQVLRCERVGRGDNFFELGGDSIISIQVVSRARAQGIRFTPKQLFEHQTVQSLAAVIEHAQPQQQIDQAPAVGMVPLLPIQAHFFEQPLPARHHWNQSVLLKPASSLDVSALECALQALLLQHDALRLGFVQAQGRWHGEYRSQQAQRSAWDAQPLLEVMQVGDLDALERAATAVQASLDLAAGPLLRAVLMQLPDEQRLLLVVHHLVIDGVSWRILFEDLSSGYANALAGRAPQLPARTSSLQAWAERLQRHAHGDSLRAQRGYWRAQLEGVDTELPCLNRDASLDGRHVRSVSMRLDRETSRRLLQDASGAYRTQVNDLLLAALARVVSRWTGRADTLIQLEGHGREELFVDIDLTRTVGWFTSLFPVRLTAHEGLGETVKAVKEQLRSIPDKGLGYGLLRYLGEPEDRALLASLPVPRITFNYMGQFDTRGDDEAPTFVPTGEARGAEQGEGTPLANWLLVNGRIYEGELSISWTFSEQMFETPMMQGLADDYAEELVRVIAHCSDRDNGAFTPSDLPLAGLDQAQLDRLALDVRNCEDLYPLSPMQAGMLFHSLDGQSAGSYVNQMSVEVFGLDVQRFRQAWQQTLDAQDILRTGFIWQGDTGRALQRVQRHVPLPFEVLDWRDRDDQAQALQQLADEQRAQGFDLAQAPLLRLLLVRCDEQRHQLIYTSHHILMDGWSNSQLMGQVLQRYHGEQPPALAARYRDYIAWLQERDAQASEAFWSEQLRELSEPTRLASVGLADAPAGQGEYRLVLEPALGERLQAFTREQKITFNTLIQAAWLVLLQRYTGQACVAFGATVAGRPVELADAERQLGLFINTLPVVATPVAQMTVQQWLQSVQTRNLDLREHEHAPLFEIQRWAGRSGESLFDTIVVFENYPVAQALEQGSGKELRFGTLHSREQTHYPLTLLVSQQDARVTLQFNHQHAAFSEAAVQAMAGHLQRLIQCMAEDPQRALGELDMLGEHERSVLLHERNDNRLAFAGERCIHQHFEAQVNLRGDAVALIAGEQSLSYAQLNRRANSLARRLIGLGVGAEVRVGVAMPRSAELLVALMAVLKAGGTYVPLDPDYPAQRVAYMLEDSQAKVLLSQAEVLAQLQVPEGVAVVEVSADTCVDDEVQDNPQVTLCADNLAYVIYTSGSTGRPKGVSITHGNVAALIAWSASVYSQADIQGVLASTSVCFDLSVWELFVTLANGGRVIMARNALELPYLAARDQVSLINTVPSAIAALQRAGQIPPGVRIVNLAGEPLRQALVEQLYAEPGIERVYDLYGPSEDTTYSTWTQRQAGGTPSIGRPLANTQAYLLDTQLQLAPEGCAAELLLAGAGVTRGYLGRPGLTAERFIPDPFGAPGGRLYRTSDLCRYRDDGELEYIGRLDHQVKIRGFRIELGEIEARLGRLDEVRECAVLALASARGAELVAYVVPGVAGDERALAEQMRQALRSQLPDYMVPGHVLFIEQLPLTPNGKLDRKALPGLQNLAGRDDYVAPASELARQVAAIWQDALQVERVGMNDNFFELGGHSLLVVSVVSKIQLELGMKLTPQTLFQYPQLERFVEQLAEQGPALDSGKLDRLDALLDEMEAL